MPIDLILVNSLSMIVTKSNNKQLYQELHDARQATLIEALSNYYLMSTWMTERCQEIEDTLKRYKKMSPDELLPSILELIDVYRLEQVKLSEFRKILLEFKTQTERFNYFTKDNQRQMMYAIARKVDANLKELKCEIDITPVIFALSKENEIATKRGERNKFLMNAGLIVIAVTGYLLGLFVSAWLFLLLGIACCLKLTEFLLSRPEYDYIESDVPVFSKEALDKIALTGAKPPPPLGSRPGFFGKRKKDAGSPFKSEREDSFDLGL